MAKLICDRRGVLEIVDRPLPAGRLLIGSGPHRLLHDIMVAISRHGYEKDVYLVPGVPEAADDDAALEAAMAFRDRVSNQLKDRK